MAVTFRPGKGSVVRVDDHDRAVVVRVLHVQRLAGLLGAEVGAARAQVPVVEVPDHAGPGVVQHPLDDAGGGVLVAAEGLDHGAVGLVGLDLGLAGVLLDGGRRAVARVERLGEDA